MKETKLPPMKITTKKFLPLMLARVRKKPITRATMLAMTTAVTNRNPARA